MNDYFVPISEGYRNNLMFHTVEVDKTKIETFVKEGFEGKLGKGSVLNLRISSYPNEYIVAVTLRKETPEALSIAQKLRKIFIDSNLPIAIYTKEAQAEVTD
jgi:hypothetical protein